MAYKTQPEIYDTWNFIGFLVGAILFTLSLFANIISYGVLRNATSIQQLYDSSRAVTAFTSICLSISCLVWIMAMVIWAMKLQTAGGMPEMGGGGGGGAKTTNNDTTSSA